MKNENVSIAVFYSRLTNMKKQNPVADSVLHVSALPKKADFVYDLTVEDVHEFFANGVLVHNCMDAGRYGMTDIMRPVGVKVGF
ncbi:MAG: hypothetical protein LBU81_03080 [Methanosarcinales archaeon]|nr:hypothetical protein [Methanosarcinales archaeon]